MFLSKKDKIHFIGIGGMSMSALASILKQFGYNVQGSDINNSVITKKLKENGIKVFKGHDASYLKGVTVVIYNYAIKEDNPELFFARQNNILVVSRGELLGYISKWYKNVISISGAHGKTTTTGMIASVFLYAKKNPTVHLGGILNTINSNFYIGDKNYFITEACEYHDCFLNLKSDVGVILNIEKEHLDYFKNYRNILNSFLKFAKNSNYVVNNEKTDYQNGVKVGKNETYSYKHIKYKKEFMTFDAYKNGKKYSKIKLKCYGNHNVKNALFTIAVCEHYDINKKDIVNGLMSFNGTKRRFEKILSKPLIIHDYAHHPREIESAINTLSKISKKQRIVVFQPHTYTRTITLKQDFINVLKNEKELIILKTFPSREKYKKEGSAYMLYKELKKYNKNVLYFDTFKKCECYLKGMNLKKKSVLFLGAGDIDKLALRFKM